MSKRKKSDLITKNLTFAPVVATKAEEIQRDSGEVWTEMCARLINDEYDRKFPCTCRATLRAKARRKTPPDPDPKKATTGPAAGKVISGLSAPKTTRELDDGKS